MAKKNEIAKVESASIHGRLNEQVKRNIERFPEDFMFQLNKEEFENWKSQFAISNSDSSRSQFAMLDDEEKWKSQIAISNSIKMGARKLPYAFTESGIAMLSGVLRSPQAVNMNIQIMRAFVAMRRFLASNAQVFQRLEVMERTQLSLLAHQESTDQKVEEIFRRLDDDNTKPTEGILFDGQIFDAYKFVTERIREAKKRIVLIDNYIDKTVLAMLDKRGKDVTAKVYTKNISRQLSLDFDKHNAQYAPIEVEQFDRAHDRFLCIDDTVYLIGASIKDLGKKWFGFTKIDGWTTDELLSKI